MVGGELVPPLALCCLFRPDHIGLIAEILQLKELAFVQIGQRGDQLSTVAVLFGLR